MKWLRKFMYGRYGIDALSMTLIVIGLILSIFSRRASIPSIVFLVLIVVAYSRAFSRNTSKRYMENQKFLKAVRPITDIFNKARRKIRSRKNYKYFTCKSCRQKIRVPRGKGKVKVRCPKCGETMIKKT